MEAEVVKEGETPYDETIAQLQSLTDEHCAKYVTRKKGHLHMAYESRPLFGVSRQALS